MAPAVRLRGPDPRVRAAAAPERADPPRGRRGVLLRSSGGPRGDPRAQDAPHPRGISPGCSGALPRSLRGARLPVAERRGSRPGQRSRAGGHRGNRLRPPRPPGDRTPGGWRCDLQRGPRQRPRSRRGARDRPRDRRPARLSAPLGGLPVHDGGGAGPARGVLLPGSPRPPVAPNRSGAQRRRSLQLRPGAQLPRPGGRAVVPRRDDRRRRGRARPGRGAHGTRRGPARRLRPLRPEGFRRGGCPRRPGEREPRDRPRGSAGGAGPRDPLVPDALSHPRGRPVSGDRLGGGAAARGAARGGRPEVANAVEPPRWRPGVPYRAAQLRALAEGR